jgi:MFS family permease
MSVKSSPATGVSRSLWRDRAFATYWTGQVVSRMGVQIASLALPLLAISSFDASALELGFVNAALFAPYLVLSMLAGVWIDRSRKRPILIAADLGRFVALVVLAILGLTGVLGIIHICVIAFVMGTCAVFFDVAGAAYLPTLIGRDRLLDGNGKLQAAIVFSKSGGPSIGGVLTELISATWTLVVSAVASLVSVVVLFLIRVREPSPKPPEGGRRMLSEIRESLAFIAGNRYLRFLTVRSGMNNLFFVARNTLLPLFVLETLGLSSTVLGLVLGAGAVGALVGSVIARPVVERIGLGRTIVVGFGVASGVQVLLPMAGGPPAVAITMLASLFAISGCFMTVGNTNVATLQQLLVPRRLLGRAVAGMRTVTWGSMPLGALFGGVLGTAIGIRAALVVVVIGFLASAIWLALSPLTTMREVEETEDE